MLVRRMAIIAGALAVLLWAPQAFAQTVTVAELSGAVSDESGGALPGVAVNVTQTDTGSTRLVTTDVRGEFSFTSLPVGPHKLVATLSGFTTFEQSSIVLRIGEARSVNVMLRIGSMSETVLVRADAVNPAAGDMATRSAERSTVPGSGMRTWHSRGTSP